MLWGRKMATVLTLQQRKQARVAAMRAGFALLREELADYGRRDGGRFWVYGSAATGRLHYESDIDILADFDEARVSAALDFVERRASELGLKADVQPKAWCTEEFLARISESALVLP